MNTNCVFCRIIDKDLPSTRVLETESILAFFDIQPVEKGHILVIPKRHFETIPEMPDGLLAEVITGVRRVASALMEVGAEGVQVMQFNHACAGQVVPHVHFHVIPKTNASVPLEWSAGAGAYQNDGERDSLASKIRSAIAGAEA